MATSSHKLTQCIRCGKDGGILCEDCYNQHHNLILNMECPICSSDRITYHQLDDSWSCKDCTNQWRDDFYYSCPSCYSNLLYRGDLGKFKCQGCGTLFDREDVLIANQEVANV